MKAQEIKLKMLRGDFSPERALNEIRATYIEIEESILDFLEGVAAGVEDFPDNLSELLPLTIEDYFDKNDKHDREACRAFWWSLKETGWEPPDLDALRWLYTEISREQAKKSQYFIGIRSRMVKGEITEGQAIREARAIREEINWKIITQSEVNTEQLTTMRIYEEQIQLGEILRKPGDGNQKNKEILEILNKRKQAERILLEQGYDLNDVMQLERMLHDYDEASRNDAPKEIVPQSGDAPLVGDEFDPAQLLNPFTNAASWLRLCFSKNIVDKSQALKYFHIARGYWVDISKKQYIEDEFEEYAFKHAGERLKELEDLYSEFDLYFPDTEGQLATGNQEDVIRQNVPKIQSVEVDWEKEKIPYSKNPDIAAFWKSNESTKYLSEVDFCARYRKANGSNIKPGPLRQAWNGTGLYAKRSGQIVLKEWMEAGKEVQKPSESRGPLIPTR